MTFFIILITTLVSILCMKNARAMEALWFAPYSIWRQNDCHRLVTGGLLHADWGHLIFNMLTLYFFGSHVEMAFEKHFGNGTTLFVVFYILALIVAHLPDLFLHKNNPQYRGVGASGAVAAVLFAAILCTPQSSIGLYFVINIPAPLFGIGYLLYCIYASRRNQDNVAHLAHFGGAIFGFFAPGLAQPALFTNFINYIEGVF